MKIERKDGASEATRSRGRWLPAFLLVAASSLLFSLACGDEGGGPGGPLGDGGAPGAGGSGGAGAAGGGGGGPGPGEERPEVVSILPRDGATGVSPSTTIRITFSKRMDGPATEAAVRLRSGGTSQAAMAEWRENSTVLILEPEHHFFPGSRVDVRIGTEARDPAGNTLAAPFEASFTIADGGDEGEDGMWGSMRWDQGSWR